MRRGYFFSLIGASAAFTALAVAAFVLFATHSHFRQKVGHDQASFDKFAARVESGSFTPETMTRLTNGWFLAQKQAHQLIQMEETVSDRPARRVSILGVCGMLAVLFQAWLIFSLRHDIKKP
jgi:hypothetical protein